MNSALMVRHPLPSPNESLLGYVLRLSESNGYSSPWSLFRLAGMTQHATRTTNFRFERLALITGCAIAKLDSIAFSPTSDRPQGSRLLGHYVLPSDLSVTKSKICPQCVVEKGFIEAHWHLDIMVGCPIHQCSAVLQCPKCRKPLRWFRPGLLDCKCGGNLRLCALPAISEAEASLLDVLRRKVLAHPVCEENPAGLPLTQLAAMGLRPLLVILRALAKHRLVADGRTIRTDYGDVVSAATRVLVEWPKNFIRLLLDLGENVPANGSVGVRKQFASIHHALFKNKAIDPPGQADFLRLAFLEFATNHWDRGCVDAKFMKELREGLPKRFVSQTEFAASIGIDPRTAARMLKLQIAPSTRLSCGKSKRIIVDMEKNAMSPTHSGKILHSRVAAKRLSLSVSVLQILRKTGSYEVKHAFPNRTGFHVLDIEAFEKRILAVASVSPIAGIDGRNLTLSSVIAGHHDSPAIKAEVVAAVLSRQITIIGNIDGTVGGISLDRSEYEELAELGRNRASGNARTPTAAARMLRCDPSAIPALARLGYLHGNKTPVGLRVKDDSIEAFSREYISLASIAKKEGTSSRALMGRCKDIGITLLSVPVERRGGPQSFVRVVDSDKLRAGMNIAANQMRVEVVPQAHLQGGAA